MRKSRIKFIIKKATSRYASKGLFITGKNVHFEIMKGFNRSWGRRQKREKIKSAVWNSIDKYYKTPLTTTPIKVGEEIMKGIDWLYAKKRKYED